MEETVRKAREWAISELEQYGDPPAWLFISAAEEGERIAKLLNADGEVVLLGMWLMDIRLPRALHEGRPQDHLEMCVDASRDFLSQFSLDEETVGKVINCVAGHHGTVEWTSQEAEIVANADCYKFLRFQNWLRFLFEMRSREGDFQKALKYAQEKADEKWNVLSLDVCKEELEEDYRLIKDIEGKVSSASL